MEKLKIFLEQHLALSPEDLLFLDSTFTSIQIPSKTIFIKEGKIEGDVFFLTEGIVRGYTYKNGKLNVEHLIEENNFFTPLESFMNDLPAKNSFETVTPCELYKVAKSDLEILKNSHKKWYEYIALMLNENLQCKITRVNDFQTLTAKERYIKFIEQSPQLALQVSVESVASFLGIEPQSLSRIRKQLTF